LSIESREQGFDKRISEMRKKIKDLDARKVKDDVFDDATLLALYKLVQKGWLSSFGGPISTGKESNVYQCDSNKGPLAVKIYLTRTANFNQMQKYIVGDRRFANIKKSRKETIFAWTKKEFSNLSRAKKVGLSVPTPYVWDRNILVMELIAGSDGLPYPQLRNAEVDDPLTTYQTIIEYIRVLYQKAHLVHGDLSEFNILYGSDTPWLIDMGQAVTPDHPKAIPFLLRDIENINRYFERQCETSPARDLLSEITDHPLARLDEQIIREL